MPQMVMLLCFVLHIPFLAAGNKLVSHSKEACANQLVEDKLAVNPDGFSTCWVPLESELNECLGGAVGTRSDHVFFMIGDSHSRNMVPAVEAASGMKGYGVAFSHPQLENLMDTILQEVEKRLLPGDLIVSTEWWTQLDRNDSVYQKTLSKMYGLAQKTGNQLLLIADVPELPEHPSICRVGKKSCTIDLNGLSNIRKPFQDALLAFKDTPGVSIFTGTTTAFNSWFVPGYENVPAYIDKHHISYQGSLYLAKPLCEFLQVENSHLSTFQHVISKLFKSLVTAYTCLTR